MNRSVPFLVAFLALVMASCNPSTRTGNASNKPQAINTAVTLRLLNRRTSNLLGLRSPVRSQVWISGPDAGRVVDTFGQVRTLFETNSGIVVLALDGQVHPSNERPIELVVRASSDGFISNSVRVTVRSEGEHVVGINLAEIDLPPVGVASAFFDVGYARDNGTLQYDLRLDTPPESVSRSGGAVAARANTRFYSRDAELLKGALDVSLTYFSGAGQDAVAAFPGAFVNAPLTANANATLVTGGFVAAEIFDEEGTHADWTDRNVDLSIFVPAQTINPLTNAPVEPGETIYLWNFDPVQARWRGEGSAKLGTPDERGNLPVEFEAANLAIWSAGWETRTCSSGDDDEAPEDFGLKLIRHQASQGLPLSISVQAISGGYYQVLSDPATSRDVDLHEIPVGVPLRFEARYAGELLGHREVVLTENCDPAVMPVGPPGQVYTNVTLRLETECRPTPRPFDIPAFRYEFMDRDGHSLIQGVIRRDHDDPEGEGVIAGIVPKVPLGTYDVLFQPLGTMLTPIPLIQEDVAINGTQGVIDELYLLNCQNGEPASPTIDHFTITPGEMTVGEVAVISWETSAAHECRINGNVVPAEGVLQVSPDVTTSYTIRCEGFGADAVASSLLRVTARPVLIDSFTITPPAIDEGQSVTLAWQTSDATVCSLTSFGEVAGDDMRIASPAFDTTYILTCQGEDGPASAIRHLDVRHPPVAEADLFVLDEDTTAVLPVLDNDTDQDPYDVLVVSSFTQPDAGVVTSGPGVTLRYHPPPDFHGITSFTYVVSDGYGFEDTATVNLEVRPVIDAPVTVPVAALRMVVNTSSPVIVLTGNDEDDGEDELHVEVITPPAHGMLSAGSGAGSLGVVFTPQHDFTGDDFFEFVVIDLDSARSEPRRVEFHVWDPQAPAMLVLLNMPDGPFLAGETWDAIILEVRNEEGTALPAAGICAELELISGSALLGAETRCAVGGLIGFDDLSSELAQDFTLGFLSEGMAVSPPQNVMVVPAEPARLSLAVAPAPFQVAGLPWVDLYGQPLRVGLEDVFGNPILSNSSDVIEISSNPSGAHFTAPPAILSSGFATIMPREIAIGPIWVDIADTSDDAVAPIESVMVEIVPGLAVQTLCVLPGQSRTYAPSGEVAQMVIGAPASQRAGNPFGVDVYAVDAYGHVDSLYQGTAGLETSDALDTEPASPPMFSGGVAHFSVNPVSAQAAATVTGLSALGANYPSDFFEVGPGPPDHVELVTPPGATQLALVSWDKFAVRVLDQFGNPVTDEVAAVAVRLGSGAGVLSGTLTQSTLVGIATFDDVSYSKGETITLEFVVAGADALPLGGVEVTVLDPAARARIDSFAAAPTLVQFTDQAVLDWSVRGDGPISLRLDPGGMDVNGLNSAAVTPFPALPNGLVPPQWYRLTATNEVAPREYSELAWVKSAGGSGVEGGADLTVLQDGSALVTGSYSGTVIFGNGEVNETILASGESSQNAFVARYGSDGALVWVRGITGPADNVGREIDAFPDGNVIVTGSIQGAAIFGAGEANETVLASQGEEDAFLARYDGNGNLIWARRAGGIHSDEGWSVVALADGSVLLTGSFENSATFGAGDKNETTFSSDGSGTMFVARYFGDGSLAWIKRTHGDGDEIGTTIAALPDGSAVVAGVIAVGCCSSDSTVTFGAGEAHEANLAYPAVANTDIFLAKYDADGHLVWARQDMGGFGDGLPYGISTLPNGSVFITGWMFGGAIFGAGEANETTFSTLFSESILVARYNPDGTLAWARRDGNPGDHDQGRGIVALPDGSTLVAGTYFSQAIFGAGEINETTLDGSRGYIARYNPDGTFGWAENIGKEGRVHALAIAVVPDLGVAMLTGNFEDTATFETRDGSERVFVSEGHSDVLVARIDMPNVRYLEVEPSGLAYAKHNEGPGTDFPDEIVGYSNGGALLAGSFSDTVTFGPGEPNETTLVSSTAGYTSIYLARYEADGSFVWVKSVTCKRAISTRDMVILSNGSAMLTGTYDGTATFGAGELAETVVLPHGRQDYFLANFNPDGTLAWVTGAGDEFNDSGDALVALPDGGALVAGYCRGFGVVFEEGEPDEAPCPPGVFLANYMPDGTLLTLRTGLGGSSVSDMNLFSDGSLLIGGSFAGVATFGTGEPGMTQLISEGGSDAYLTKYNPDGALAWARSDGGSSSELVDSVLAYADGSSAMLGLFTGATTFGHGEPGETTLSLLGTHELFLARYTPEGTLAWVRQGGGPAAPFTRNVAIGLPDGSAAIAGAGYSPMIFQSGEFGSAVLDDVAGSGTDAFIVRYRSDGTISWATSFGSDSHDSAESLGALPDGSILVGGSYQHSVVMGAGEAMETTLPYSNGLTTFLARYFPYPESVSNGFPGGRPIEIVSVDSDEAQLGGIVQDIAGISADGRFALFSHYIDDGSAPLPIKVTVRDRLKGITEIMNMAFDGGEEDGQSWASSISGDGRYVLIHSSSTNLIADDTNSHNDLFVRDRILENTECVSRSSNGALGNGYTSTGRLSGDGRYVAFESDATNLVLNDTNGVRDIFIRDRALGTTLRVSESTSGVQSDGSSYTPEISSDGRFVTFGSYGSSLIAGDSNGEPDLFVYDRDVAGDGVFDEPGDVSMAFATGYTSVPQGMTISDDGRFIAFDSTSSTLVADDTNGVRDVFVRDTQTDTVVRINLSENGGQVSAGGLDPHISGDGRYILFLSHASDLVSGDSNPDSDAFVAPNPFLP